MFDSLEILLINLCFFQISTIVFSRHTRVKFNPLWLDNIYEKVIIENQVDEINPLVVNPGRLVLTSSSIYFQPYNNIQPVPVINIKLKSLYSLIKRRFLLRHVVSIYIIYIKSGIGSNIVEIVY